jgi:predicted nucleic acid-binding protein
LSLLLLDTSFLIDAERAGGSADGPIEDDDEVAVAAVTIAELLAGVYLAQGRRRAARRRFASRVLDEIPVIPYDLAVAAAHGELRPASRRPRPHHRRHRSGHPSHGGHRRPDRLRRSAGCLLLFPPLSPGGRRTA